MGRKKRDMVRTKVRIGRAFKFKGMGVRRGEVVSDGSPVAQGAKRRGIRVTKVRPFEYHE